MSRVACGFLAHPPQLVVGHRRTQPYHVRAPHVPLRRHGVQRQEIALRSKTSRSNLCSTEFVVSFSPVMPRGQMTR